MRDMTKADTREAQAERAASINRTLENIRTFRRDIISPILGLSFLCRIGIIPFRAISTRSGMAACPEDLTGARPFSLRCSPGSADAAQQNEMQSRKCGCNTAKRDAVQEVRMQHSKTRCSPGSADAVQQNEMQSRKCGCSTAKRDAVQEVRMQHSKTRCSPGSADAVQQNEMQSSKCGCSTAKRDAVQQVRMQHSKTRCSPASADAEQQNDMQSSKCGCSLPKRWKTHQL